MIYGNLQFELGENNYRLERHSKNPFERRVMAEAKTLFESAPQHLKIGEVGYGLKYFTGCTPHLRRRVNFTALASFKPNQIKPIFKKDLPSNPKLFQFNLRRFVRVATLRFKSNPFDLRELATEISLLAEHANYKIPHLKAFDKIESHERFLRLLESISQKEGPFQFEFLMAAILQYSRYGLTEERNRQG